MTRVRASAARTSGRGRLRAAFVCAVLLLAVVAAAAPSGSVAEQASEPAQPQAGRLDGGRNHTCAIYGAGSVRCWGFNAEGQLGYGNRRTIGDDETAGSAGPVDLGGENAEEIALGDYHTCARTFGGKVYCWGFNANGQLGYGSRNTVGDEPGETPAARGPVPLPAGLTAVSIAAGGAHTCALLSDQSVRCWGYAYHGELGFGGGDPNIVPDPSNPEPGRLAHPQNFADDPGESPANLAPIDFGADDRAIAVTAGRLHTCAILVDNTVRCWGHGGYGQIGYPRPTAAANIAAPPAEPVDIGASGTASAISAGEYQTCVVLTGGSVRCWGNGLNGKLGTGSSVAQIGDDESPSTAPTVDLGPGRFGEAISTGSNHTCAKLNGGDVRCWGRDFYGELGTGRKAGDRGDDEPVSTIPLVNLGAGRSALAIATGYSQSCARLDDGSSVICWGSGANGRLGYCNERNVGDNEAPGAIGPVPVDVSARAPSTAYRGCARVARPAPPAAPAEPAADPFAAEASRLRDLRGCYARAARHARGEIRRARRVGGERRARLRRHIKRHRSAKRRACRRRHGRTPGRVSGLRGEPARRSVLLRFDAAGTDGDRPPAARTYVIKQSLRPIRGRRAFRRAQTLCNGGCRFPTIREVGADVSLRVRDLRRRTTYYYAVAARDNVSKRLGRARTLRVRTR